MSDAEIVRLEGLGRLAWPALETLPLDGWCLGSSGTYTRRANSIAPESDGTMGLAERIERAEAFYRARGRRSVFKMTRAARPPELDRCLGEQGYSFESETVVQVLDLNEADWPAVTREGAAEVRIDEARIQEDWFDASVEFSNVSPACRDDYRALLEQARGSTDRMFFGRAEEHGRIRSVALGCRTEDAVSLLQVATAEDERGRRLAESVLRAILAEARDQHCEFGLLSVEAANAPARRLYARLGFSERYRYWYRAAPDPDASP